MATISETSSNSPENAPESAPRGNKRRVQKVDVSPTQQDIAAEAEAIYPDTFPTPPTPEEIAAEAYAIYIQRGGGDGRDADDWYEAERRLNERARTRRTE